MSDTRPMNRDVDHGLGRRITLLCDAFAAALAAESAPKIEDYLRLIPEPSQTLLLNKLIEREMAFYKQSGEQATRLDYKVRFPQLDERDLDRDSTAIALGDLLSPDSVEFTRSREGTAHCPFCQQTLACPREGVEETRCPSCGGVFRVRGPEPASTVEYVRQLENFQLLLRRGQGSFGTVWKARDTELDRLVAIKIPYASILSDPGYLERTEREIRRPRCERQPSDRLEARSRP